MKNLLLTLVAILPISLTTMALERKVSIETSEVATALLDEGVMEKAHKFNQYSDALEAITIDELEDITIIKITGINLLGGDIPIGKAELVITKSFAPVLGFPHAVRPVYHAEVSYKGSR